MADVWCAMKQRNDALQRDGHPSFFSLADRQNIKPPSAERRREGGTRRWTFRESQTARGGRVLVAIDRRTCSGVGVGGQLNPARVH